MSAVEADHHFGNRGFKGHGFIITVIVTALIGLLFGVFTSLGIQWLTPVLFG